MYSSLSGARRRVAIACLSSMILLSGCPDAEPVLIGPGNVATWTAYGGTPGGTHYSTATQITPGNVRSLELA